MGSLHKWFSQSRSKDGKPGWVQSDGSPCANEKSDGKKTPKCFSSSKLKSMSKGEIKSAVRRKREKDPNQQSKSGAAKPTYVSTDKPKKKMKKEETDMLEATYPSDFIGRDGKPKPVANKKKGMPKAQVPAKKELDEAKDKKGKGSGTKDACYHKVKSRYSVWPSAYASGALVKCRKAGAKNWGNSTKKEELSPTIDPKAHNKEKRAAKIGNLARNTTNPNEKAAAERKRTGPKLMGENAGEQKYCLLCKKNETREECSWGPSMWDKYTTDKLDIESPVEEGCITYSKFMTEAAAWTRKAGKNPSGGLNEKGRKSYERENPGSDLKAPSKKVGNKRRASFCARMKGMKKKLTSAKTANDPDSRINKSLRAWNC